VASLLPEELLELEKWMSEERAKKLLSEFDEPLKKLAIRIGKVKVIKHLDEIEKIKAPPLEELADAIGKAEVAQFLDYIDNHKYLEDYAEPGFLQNSPGAVLLKADIEKLCVKDEDQTHLPLIDPLEEAGLKPASYKLRLGSRCWVKEEPCWLTKVQPKLEIPPHGIAIVSTYEWLNIPGFLIARWNLRVSKVYTGLVWVGGPQVDPGYQGFLPCPLYNLSNKTQVLEYKEPLFTIDFVKTTPFDNTTGKLWSMPENKLATFDFKRLVKDKIESAPTELQRQVDECNKEVSRFEKEMDGFKKEIDKEIYEFKAQTQTTEFGAKVVLTIIVAALGILTAFEVGTDKWTSDTYLIILATIALVISIVALFVSLVFKRRG